ncbi:MAG: leucine-rich repeat domain-containing protein [Clostridia bacterium]|jgi:hypothetical protein|nr:leucine-rich repeat domain-containing protein [Clostridia bacterium]MBQ4365184.1 leucine-rich repeat domain-containing protein [Clostridia bacterium]MBR3094024.1 leucine-rich repeat domain-containing protein [Clostridia bacterium]
MKKQLQSALCALLALVLLASVCCVPALAASDLSYKVTEYGYAMVTRCSESATGTVKVPATVKLDGKTYDVKFIGEKAFENCKYVEEITIAEGVTQIGSKAFKNCESLRTVSIPRTLTSCEYDAFEGCENVTVNCYSSNYQFFSVYGLSKNIQVRVLDKHTDEQDTKNMNALGDFIKRIIDIIASWFRSLIKK